MGIRFILMVNKKGQTKLAQYHDNPSIPDRRSLEGEIIHKGLLRTERQVTLEINMTVHRNYKIIYRRYASLFFLVGVDDNENELVNPEFIHLLVEAMDRHFGNACELDITICLEKTRFVVEEMVKNGCIVQTDKNGILFPLHLTDRISSRRRQTQTTTSFAKRHDPVAHIQQLQR